MAGRRCRTGRTLDVKEGEGVDVKVIEVDVVGAVVGEGVGHMIGEGVGAADLHGVAAVVGEGGVLLQMVGEGVREEQLWMLWLMDAKGIDM